MNACVQQKLSGDYELNSGLVSWEIRVNKPVERGRGGNGQPQCSVTCWMELVLGSMEFPLLIEGWKKSETNGNVAPETPICMFIYYLENNV